MTNYILIFKFKNIFSLPAHDQIMTTIEESLTHASTSTYIPNPEFTPKPDYKQLYITLNKDYEILKCENTKIKEELSTFIKQYNYKDINESLRFNIKNLRTTISKLNETNKTMSKQIKTLSLTKTKMTEATARKYLMSIFSLNQLDLMFKKKEKSLLNKGGNFQGFYFKILQ